MYTDVSERFKKEISKTSRSFKSRINVNGNWYTNIKSVALTQGSCDEDNITIGSSVSAYIEINMKDIGEYFENTEVELQQGLVYSDGSIEYITLGYYTAQRPQEDNGYIKFTAYDRMQRFEKVYTSKLIFPATAQQIWDEICDTCNVPTDVKLDTIYIQEKPQGYTCREVLGYLASLHGKFIVIDRTGKLVLKFYTDYSYDIAMSKTYSFTKNQADYRVEYLCCNIDKNTQLMSGGGARGIVFDNPYMTQAGLDKLYSRLKDFSYRPAAIKFLGDIRLDVWDIVNVTDLIGNTYSIPIMKMTHIFDGGVATTIEAAGKTEEEVNTDFKGPVTRGLERTYAELLLANTIIANKVDADWVKANTVTTEKLSAVNAEIINLKANKVDADWVKANTVTTEQLNAVNGRIQTLEVKSLTADSAEILSLKANVADINTLMFGTASGGSLTTEFSNTVAGLIGDAQIKSAMIKDISADKILSGRMYTNLVEIVSQSGNLDISDNTIQIRDNNNTARVQIGKDAAGDYNIYIWDKSGKLMFDPLYGVQADGIKKAIIRNDMISDTANISGKKIDIASLITSINADGSSTLNASKIYVDTDKQTLDVSFKNLTTSVSTVSTSVTTAVNTSNAAATTANSAATTANNANSTANTAKTTADTASRTATAANNTANKAKNTADTANKTATTANNTANTANSNASSALSKANTLKADLKTVTDKVTTQGTQLTAIQGNISSKIWQQDITTAVTGLEIGGRNLLRNSNFAKGNSTASSYWSNWGSPAVREYVTINNKKWCHIKGSEVVYQGICQNTGVNNIDKNTGYVVSVRVKGAEDKQGFCIGIHWINSSNTIIKQQWKNYSVNKTESVVTLMLQAPEYVHHFNIMLGFNSKDQYEVYFTDVKLEKGTKATDWTPAPEDVDSSIASLEGSTKTLSTQYTSLNQTLTSLSATVNSNTTAITKKADGSTVTSLQSKVTSLQTDLNGYKTTVTNTYVTKSTLGNYATTSAMNSAINQKANSITQSVSATYATKSEFNDMQIGGRNYIPMDMSYWERGTISAGTRTDSTTRMRTKSARAIQGGAKYILSKYGTGKILLFFYDSNYKYISSPDWFKTFPKTFTAPANAKYFNAVIAYDNDGTITDTDSIKFKLEKGTKATDWTPAAEDMATKASLELKIDKSDNGKIISMINASADAINLKANRLSWSSVGTSMTREGNFTCITGVIGSFTIDSSAIYGADSGMCKNTGQTYDYAFYAGAAYASRGYAKYAVTHAGDVYSNGSAYFNGSATFNGVTNANGEFYVNTSRYGKCAAALTDPSQSIKLFYDAGAKNLLFYLNGTIIANLYT